MPLWKVGAQFVKKHCINDAKKSFFCYVLQCFVNFNILPQDTQKSANQNLETATPPPKPPPAKPTGEKLKAIFIAFRHRNLELSPPPQQT